MKILKRIVSFVFKAVVMLVLLAAVGGLFLFINHWAEGQSQLLHTWALPVVATLIVGGLWGFMRLRFKRAEDTKYNFLTVASHRLRTPLTRMQWSIEGLKEYIGAEGKEMLTNAETITEELIEISDHLLNAAESGEGSLYYDYIFERGDLAAVARNAVAQVKPGAVKKDINIKADVEPRMAAARIDRERLTMAATALVENAVLYTPKGGTITVRAYQKGAKLIFSVEDTGIGISKSAMPHIFTQFFRAKEAVSVEQDRAGLGLFIAREVVRKHGGTIHAQSDGKDKGSHFWFTLPAIR